MDEMVRPPKSETLRALYWRSEILQVMYWLRGEGLDDDVDLAVVTRFLGVEAAVAAHYLERLVDEGYLHCAAGHYALSERGASQGALEFATAFGDMVRPAPGACSRDCWCHTSDEEAAACAGDRALKFLH